MNSSHKIENDTCSDIINKSVFNKNVWKLYETNKCFFNLLNKYDNTSSKFSKTKNQRHFQYMWKKCFEIL